MSNNRKTPFDPNRRRLLTGLGAAGGSLLLAGCGSGLSRNQTVQAALGSTDTLTQRIQNWLGATDARVREYPPSQISAHPRPNGTTDPTNTQYQKLAADHFADWHLTVDGLVAKPLKLSLADLKSLPSQTQITRHDCVEGWSYIAQWTGVRLSDVLNQVVPADNARYVVFHCADNFNNGPDKYYESIDLATAHHPQTLLAYGLNDDQLPIANGAPLRLRAEGQLGYKMAKYITRIELVEHFADIQGGHGGYWEDRGYYWWAGI